MSSRIARYPQLDGLRALAAGLVVLYHALPTFRIGQLAYGWIGVDIFFVISGYLITAILLEQRKACTNRYLVVRNFVVKRVLRLFPAYYFLILSLSLARAAFGLWSWNPGEGIWFLTYTSNILTFLHGFRSSQVNHLWTLAVEEQFYLFWPWLLLFLPRKVMFRSVALLVVLSFAFKTACHAVPHVRVLTISNLDTLGGGALMAIMGLNDRLSRWTTRRVRWFALAGLCGLFLHSAALPDPLLLNASVWVLAMALVSGCVLGWSGGWGRLLEHPWMVHAGLISYGIYLYHKPVISAIGIVLSQTGLSLHPAVKLVLALTATCLIAEISYRFLERPFLRLKDRFDL
jgi:peptidoglycan/LPS O-acetylase OafA/YrhL